MKRERADELRNLIEKEKNLVSAIERTFSILEEAMRLREYDIVSFSYVALAVLTRKVLYETEDKYLKEKLKKDRQRFLELSQIYAMFPSSDLAILFDIYNYLFTEKFDDYDVRAIVLALEGIAKDLKDNRYKEAVRRAVYTVMKSVNDLKEEDIKRIINT